MGKRLKLGVLGCAKIAHGFVRDVLPSDQVEVVAVASRDLSKAQAFADQYGLPQAWASYEALLADPNVEAIYLPLPNTMHAPWAMAAARAGKHVLCEKPLTLTRASAQEMFDTARQHGVMLLESFPYYFQPQTGDMLALLASGAIGQVRSVQATFGFTLAPQATGNIRFNPVLGGGALLDAGSYPLSLIRLVMGQAPVRVLAQSSWTASGVDMATTATLEYADGRRAQLMCAMDVANVRHATISGSAGTLETEYLNHTADAVGQSPHGYLPSQMRLRRGIANTLAFEDIRSPSGSGFRFAAEAFAKVIREQDHDAVARAAQASIDNAATLEALARSARTGAAVKLK
ncbi:MAG: hypothetical protein RLZ63_251 [Pseudomonadota bacterium]|jgi:predicted dehydrogenase